MLFGVVASVATLASVPAAGQTRDADGGATSSGRRTAWGDPNLQGIWRGLTVVPFERPVQFANREFLTDAEVAAKVKAIQAVSARRRRGETEFRGFRGTPGYNQVFAYTDDKALVSRRTSAIIDPPDGQVPPWTVEQAKRYEEREAATHGHTEADTTADINTGARCIPDFAAAKVTNYGIGFGGVTTTESLHAAYGNEKARIDESVDPGFLQNTFADTEIVQGPGYVAMVIAEAFTAPYRIIPLDGRAPLGPNVRQLMGSARGHWDEDSLVVELTNITYPYPVIPNYGVGGLYPGTAETLRVIERWTRVNADTIEVRRTIEDPAVYTRPYTVIEELTRDDGYKKEPRLCHENNSYVGNIFGQARNDELLSMENAAEAPRQREPWLKLRKEQALKAAAERQRSSSR